MIKKLNLVLTLSIIVLNSNVVMAAPMQLGDKCTQGTGGTCASCPGGNACKMYTTVNDMHWQCGVGQGSGGFCEGSMKVIKNVKDQSLSIQKNKQFSK